MDLKNFATIFFKSLNPFKYSEIILFRKRDVFAYFFLLIFFAILLGGIFTIPTLGYLPQKIDESLAKFSRFAITGLDIEANESLLLLNSPRVVLDLRDEPESHDAFFVITKSDLFIKKFSPDIMQFTLYNTTKIPVEQYSDLLSDFNMVKRGIWIFLFFMLPSIIFFIYVLNLIKYAVIMLVAYLLLVLYKLAAKKALHFDALLKTLIFSSSIMIFSEITLAPFIDLKIVPLCLFIIYYLIGQHTRSPRKKESKEEDNDGFISLEE